MVEKEELPKYMKVDDIGRMLGMPRWEVEELYEEDLGFPRPVKFGSNQRWIRSEVVSYVQARIDARETEPDDRAPGTWTFFPKRPDANQVIKELAAYESQLMTLDNLYFPPCVYFLVSDGKLAYVGKTTMLTVRVAKHLSGDASTSRKTFDKVFYIVFPEDELATREREFIALLKPPLNKSR